MNWAAPLLEHGGFLIAGTSAFLALGVLINLLQRAPIQRLRIAEMAVGCALVFALLTFAPLPRALVSTEATAPASEHSAFDFGPTQALIASAKSDLMTPRIAPPMDGLTLLPDDVAAESEPITSRLSEAPAATSTVELEVPASAGVSEPAFVLPFPVDRGLLALWLIGASASAIWLLFGALRVRSVLRQSRRAPRPVLRLLRERGVELPSRVRLRLSDRPVRPFCVGLFRPTIVIPSELLEDQQDPSLVPVVHHELAHASQRDARGLWLFAIAQVPLWFHPLFWWLRAQHRFATELVADDIAAGNTSNRAYARELVHLVERQSAEAAPVVGATALFRTHSDFYRRMQMLLTRRQPLATRTSLRRRALHSLFGLALLTCASSLGGSTPALAQDPVQQQQEQIIADLRAENAALRASLDEMTSSLSQMRDMLTQMQYQSDARAARAEQLQDAWMQSLVEKNQHDALKALGYMAVEEYTVQAGDTLPSILGDREVRDLKFLERINELNPGLMESVRGGYRVQTLKPGQVLLLPSDREGRLEVDATQETTDYTALKYVVQEGDSIYQIAAKHDLTTRELQLLFYGLNADKFGDKVPDEMHSYQLSVGETLKIPVPNGDGEVIARATEDGLLQLMFSYRDLSGRIHGQDQLVDPATQSIYWGRLTEDGTVADPRAEDALLADAFNQAIEQGHGSGGGFGDDPFGGDLPTLDRAFDRGSGLSSHQQMPAVDLSECMEIAFRAIDMEGELEAAVSRLEYSRKLFEQGLVNDQEMRQDELALQTLQRKIKLSRQVVEARIADFEQQVHELQGRYTEEHPNYPHRAIDLRKRAITILAEAL